MSADDFQSKYASVMESMLKSAVAETTKLFETMVDELKAEISRIKKENEDLKTRCSLFESERGQLTVDTRESEPPPGPSDGSEKRDTAVQCDLVPFHTMLIEQCQPLQNQQCGYEEMEYALQEHDYGTREEGNSQMALIVVKQEAVLKQEEIESTVVCGQVLRNKTDSPWASPCPIENEGPFINTVCSTRDMPLPQRHEEMLELPFSGTCCGAQNQSSESEHSLVISVAAIKDDMEEESEVSQKISEAGTQGGLVASEKQQLVTDQSEVEPLEKEQPSEVPQQCQREDKMSVNEQTDVTLQQHTDVQSTHEQLAQPTPVNKGEACEELKNGVTEVEASSQPDLSVRRRRGRPPKKAKRLKQPVKEKLNSPSSDIPKRQQDPSSRLEEVKDSSVADTANITSSESPQTCPVQPKGSTSITTPSILERTTTTLEDAENRKVGSQASLCRRRSSKKDKTSESQQLSKDMEEGGTVQVPLTEVSSAVERLNIPPSEPPQAASAQARERCTSVTLQDAMLLIEAMNQSPAENASSSPQRKAVSPQTQPAPSVGTMETVDEVPAEPQTAPLPGETCKAVSNLPLTELSTRKQSTASPEAKDVTPTSEAQAHIEVARTKQQHTISVSSTTTSTLPLSTAATQTSVQSLQQHPPHPLIKSVAHSRQGNAVPHKIIVVPRSLSSLKPHKVAVKSTAQLPTVLSTVVVSQNKSILPRTPAAGIPAGTTSLSSVPQKTIYVSSSKLLPVVTQSTATSTDMQSETQPNPKMTIIIPRQMSVVASMKQKSQTSSLTAQQESTKSSGPVMMVMSSSKESDVSMETQTALDKVATVLSQKRDITSDNLESPKQPVSVPETINAQTQTLSNLNMPVGLVPASMSPTSPPGFEQKRSAVVRLTRLPFPISTKESVVVSRLPTNGSSDSQSAEICPNLKETPVSVEASQMSEEPNDIEEKPSVSSENYTTLEDSLNNGYVQPSLSFEVSQPIFEKSTTISTTELSALFGTAVEPTSNLGQEIIEVEEEKQSAALIHLTSITSKDTADPHLQMTKTQFLAQLAVSPVAEDHKKASSKDSVDARASCAGTSTSDKKTLQKKSLMAQLRTHIKTHLQARRTEANLEHHTETETHTVGPKKTRLENDHSNDENTTSNIIPLSPKNTVAVQDVTSLKQATNDPPPISPRRSGLCKDGVKSRMTVGESSSVSSRRSTATSESPPLSPRKTSLGRDGVCSRNKKSTSVNPRRLSSTKESVTPKRMKNTSMSARRLGSTKHSPTPRKTKNTSECPRSGSAKESATCKKTTNKNSSTRDSASPKNTKTGGHPNSAKATSVRSGKTSLSGDGASLKMTKSISVSPRTSGVSKNDTSPKTSANEPTSFCRRRCTLTKDGFNTKQIKRESISISPSTDTDGTSSKTTKSETNYFIISLPKWDKDDVSPGKIGESTSIKKPRLIEDGTSPRKNLGVNSSCEAVKKCTVTAVWTPPTMPASKMPPAGGKKSAQLPVKKNAVSPGSPDRPVVYPPSVSLYPIPVKAPPVVSPLQPLSVIGWRLLKNQCGECGRVLSSSAALESHVSLHKGRRPFSCTLCGKRFPDSKALKRHGRVHRNGRIHICQQCGKGFVYRFSLTKHLQMVHGRLKPFVCQICEKGFFTKRDVEAHIRIHTGEKPFHCNLCEKKFARRVELNVHLRWHNGEKRHWCPYCGKGFLDFNNLKRHKYIHTGEKPHSCPHCPKSFTQSGHLKKHVKNVHKMQ